MKYKVGDKVIIVSERVEGMNDNGLMDCFLGDIMTIEKIRICGDYKMLEDNEVWFWDEHMINHEATFNLNHTNRTKGI